MMYRHPVGILIFPFFTVMLSAYAIADGSRRPVAVPLQQDLAAVESYVMRYGPRPSEAAVSRIIAAAKSERPDARVLYCAGTLAAEGWTTEINELDVWALAASKGDSRATTMRAAEYCIGKKVARDVERGLADLRAASAKGDSLADYYLGTLQANGVPNLDLNAAQAHLQRAAAGGMLRALGALAQIAVHHGRDQAQIFESVRNAAAAGDPEMILAMVNWYDTGGPGKDLGEALAWARRGALLGYPALMANYAIMLERGYGGAKGDPTVEASLLQRAAELGSLDAQAMLEVGRITGQFGIAINREEALQNLRELANGDHPPAQLWLGRLLVEGKEVPKDEVKGRRLIESAAKNGDEGAKQWLEKNPSRQE
jgi:TPR repeat protein